MPSLRPHPVSLLHGGHRLHWCSQPSPVDQDQLHFSHVVKPQTMAAMENPAVEMTLTVFTCLYLKDKSVKPVLDLPRLDAELFIQKNNVHSTCGWSQRSFYKFCQDMNFAIWRSVLGTRGAKHSGWLMVDDPASQNSPSSLKFKKHLGSCLTTLTARRGGDCGSALWL